MSEVPGGGRGRHLRVFLWVGLAALLTRAAYLTEHLGSPFFGVPILDEAFYDAVARSLLAGEPVTAVDPGFRPLLYPAFLALAYVLGGTADAVAAVVFQHLLGIGVALLVTSLALASTGSRAAGLAAGLLYVLAGPPLFFEGERLIATLFTFLVVLTLRFLVAAEARDSPALWVAAGVAAALGAQARPNALVFLPLFLAVGIWRWLRGPRGRAAGPLFWTPAAMLGALLLAGWLQAPFLEDFHVVPAGSGGVNFYLGNEREADGMTPVQDRGVVVGEAYRDSVEVFAREAYQEATGWDDEEPPPPGAVSAYWLRRGLEEIRADPAGWLRLLGRKALLLLWNEEIPNNKSYRFVVEEESRVLARMPVGWWLLLALAPLGWLEARGTPGAFWLPAFLLVYGGSLLLFFVNSRFRIPLWPAMAALAGAGIVGLFRALRRGPRVWVPRVAAAGLLAAASLGNWAGAELPSYARDHLFRSMAAREKGLHELARADARRAVELSPGDPAAWIHLGLVEQERGELAAALGRYRQAWALTPDEPRPYNNAGVIQEELGRPALAYRLYRRALEVFPGYGPALVNAARLELRAGRPDLAAERLDRAREAGYRSVSSEVVAALVLRARGRAEAETTLDELARRHPEVVRGILAEQERPLDPAALGL